MVWIGLHNAGLMSLMYCLTYLKCNEEMKVKRAIIRFKLMENKPCIDGTYPIYLIVQYNGRAVYSVGERCSVKDWNGGDVSDGKLSVKLINIKSKVESYRMRLELDGIPYTCSSLLEVLRRDDVLRDKSRMTYIEVLESIISDRGPSVKTEENMRYAYNVLVKFIGRSDFMVTDVDESLLRRWIKSVKSWKALSIKSVLSRICDVWNTFIRLGGDRSLYPFDRIKISSYNSKASVDALSECQMDAVEKYFMSLDISRIEDRNSVEFALCCYLLSYKSMGLALVDLLKLRASQFVEAEDGWRVEGVSRSKTSVDVPLFFIRDSFTSAVLPVLLGSAHLRDGYLLPGLQRNGGGLLSDSPKRVTAQVSNMVRIVNHKLKGAWRKLNNIYKVEIPLSYTFYSARRSVASIYLTRPDANIFTLATLMARSPEGISVYIKNLLSEGDLNRERRKLLGI